MITVSVFRQKLGFKISFLNTLTFFKFSSAFAIVRKSINVDFLSIKLISTSGFKIAMIIPGIPPPVPISEIESPVINLLNLYES